VELRHTQLYHRTCGGCAYSSFLTLSPGSSVQSLRQTTHYVDWRRIGGHRSMVYAVKMVVTMTTLLYADQTTNNLAPLNLRIAHLPGHCLPFVYQWLNSPLTESNERLAGQVCNVNVCFLPSYLDAGSFYCIVSVYGLMGHLIISQCCCCTLTLMFPCC